MLSDVAGVPGGQGCIPPAPGCAVRWQAPAVAGAAWGLQGPRCPAWLVHACIVVSLGGWHAPEETGRFGGEEDGMGVQRRKASRARQGCSTHSCRNEYFILTHTYARTRIFTDPLGLAGDRLAVFFHHSDGESGAKYTLFSLPATRSLCGSSDKRIASQ
jgi:hypothetical protein